MMIGDLIKKLSEIRAAHGPDIDVVVHDPQFVFTSHLDFVMQDEMILSIEWKVTSEHDSSI